ncbi:MAG TPA: hypothetical protein VD995_24550 [Azospirillum sp.]|nr:hypothetical protein [Azospirillum sp.]
MIAKTLTTAQLEETYDMIAEAIDTAGDGRAVLFLAKLALALGTMTGDPAKVRAAIDASLRDLG